MTMSDSLKLRDAVAERLKAARAAKYRTAAEAARALKMEAPTVRAHESGQNGLSPEAAKTYADIYGVSVSWLLYGLEHRPPADEPIPFLEPNGLPPDVPPADSIPVFGTCQTNVWLDASPLSKNSRRRLYNRAIFEQPRIYLRIPGFGMLSAWEVGDDSMNEFYRKGEIVITSDASRAGLQVFDHVVTTRFRPGMEERAIREISTDEDGIIIYRSRSTDPEFRDLPPIRATDGPLAHDGVVIASFERRTRNNPQISLNATLDKIEQMTDYAVKDAFVASMEMLQPAIVKRHRMEDTLLQRFERERAENDAANERIGRQIAQEIGISYQDYLDGPSVAAARRKENEKKRNET